MQTNLLPLFPLQVVVFPRTQLPLHIFEERYKEMVGEAIRDNSEFGIVLVKEDGIVNAGCTVMVDKVLKSHPDGRMDIMTRGIRRFEIVMLDQEKSYLRGEVTYFDDDETEAAPADVQTEAHAALPELGRARGPPGDDAILTTRSSASNWRRAFRISTSSTSCCAPARNRCDSRRWRNFFPNTSPRQRSPRA